MLSHLAIEPFLYWFAQNLVVSYIVREIHGCYWKAIKLFSPNWGSTGRDSSNVIPCSNAQSSTSSLFRLYITSPPYWLYITSQLYNVYIMSSTISHYLVFSKSSFYILSWTNPLFWLSITSQLYRLSSTISLKDCLVPTVLYQIPVTFDCLVPAYTLDYIVPAKFLNVVQCRKILLTCAKFKFRLIYLEKKISCS